MAFANKGSGINIKGGRMVMDDAWVKVQNKVLYLLLLLLLPLL